MIVEALIFLAGMYAGGILLTLIDAEDQRWKRAFAWPFLALHTLLFD